MVVQSLVYAVLGPRRSPNVKDIPSGAVDHVDAFSTRRVKFLPRAWERLEGRLQQLLEERPDGLLLLTAVCVLGHARNMKARAEER